MKKFVSAIIVSAGNSTRMGEKINKQFINIFGKPAILYTITAFEKSDDIDEIVIVCKDEHKEKIFGILKDNNIKKVSNIVNGGNSRQESVKNGIKAANKEATHFCINDGARRLITPNMISNVVNKAIKLDCATLGVPVKDTIKVVNEDGFINYTPDRSKLWAIQTPQVFKKEIYLNALKVATKLKMDYTDDCQIVESNNQKVYVQIGSFDNIKLTTIEDVKQVKAILKDRGYK